MSADYETFIAVLEDRVEEAERRVEELEKRIDIGRALHQMSPFGFFHCPNVLDGQYDGARTFLKDIEATWQKRQHPA